MDLVVVVVIGEVIVVCDVIVTGSGTEVVVVVVVLSEVTVTVSGVEVVVVVIVTVFDVSVVVLMTVSVSKLLL